MATQLVDKIRAFVEVYGREFDSAAAVEILGDAARRSRVHIRKSEILRSTEALWQITGTEP
jgi:hypothetical protein